MAVAIFSSLAFMTDEVAAIAEPPQILEPTPIRIEVSGFNFKSLCTINESTRAVIIVEIIISMEL